MACLAIRMSLSLLLTTVACAAGTSAEEVPDGTRPSDAGSETSVSADAQPVPPDVAAPDVAAPCVPGAVGCCANGASPSAEICNATDDDCDNHVDNGCPQNVTLGAVEPSLLYGGTGGGAFDGPCPAGRALVGFEGRAGDRLDAIAPICAVIELETVIGTPEHSYRVRTRAATTEAAHGGGGGGAFTARCAVDEVVIGLGGRSGSGVDQLVVPCGTVLFERRSGAFAAVVTPTTKLGPHGGGGGGAFEHTCSAGRIATAVTGRSGSKVDQIGIGCALLGFTMQ